MFAYNFGLNRIRGVSDEVENAYWRDVGTIDAYFEANMDLKNVVPSLNLYNWDWPIITANYPDPPAKLVFDDETRRGVALQSVLSGGCIIAGGFVKDSVLGRNVFVDVGRAGRGVGAVRQRLRRARRARAAAPSSTRTCASPTATTSATTWRATRFATRSARGASRWCRRRKTRCSPARRNF